MSVSHIVNEQQMLSYLQIDVDYLSPCYHILYLLAPTDEVTSSENFIARHEVTSSIHDPPLHIHCTVPVYSVLTVIVQYNTEQCCVMHEETSLNVSDINMVKQNLKEELK